MLSPGNATKHLKKEHQFYTISSRKQKSKDLKYSKQFWKRIKLENTLPDFKNCYKATVINTGGFWQKDRHTHPWNKIETGRPTKMWSADFWQWCKVNSMEMTQCFQQMVLEQVDTCINHVPYFMTLFWHFKKLAGWGVTAPPMDSQFLAWEHIFHMQFQLPHHLSLTHQANVFPCHISSQGLLPNNRRPSLYLKGHWYIIQNSQSYIAYPALYCLFLGTLN